MHCIRQTTATKSFPEVKFEMYNSLSKQNVGRYRKKKITALEQLSAK